MFVGCIVTSGSQLTTKRPSYVPFETLHSSTVLASVIYTASATSLAFMKCWCSGPRECIMTQKLCLDRTSCACCLLRPLNRKPRAMSVHVTRAPQHEKQVYSLNQIPICLFSYAKSLGVNYNSDSCQTDDVDSRADRRVLLLTLSSWSRCLWIWNAGGSGTRHQDLFSYDISLPPCCLHHT